MLPLLVLVVTLSQAPTSSTPADTSAPVSSPPSARATDDVRAALAAMGGEARWRELRSLRLQGTGHQHALEQSERPEGPWLTTYVQVTELRDHVGQRLRATREQRGFWSPDWSGFTVVADADAAVMGRGDRWGPTSPTEHELAMQRLHLSPERILLSALAAPDLAAAGDTLLQGVRHDVVAFTWHGRPVRLFLNRHTRLPAGYAIPAAAGELFAVIWGDTPTLTLWSVWSLEPGGWLYPRQTDILQLGRPARSELLASVTFDAPAPADSFAVPDDARAAFAQAGPVAADMGSMRPGSSYRGGEPAPAAELAPGVVSRPGVYAATWIEQDDGVVVLDGPMTSAWSAAVLDESERHFPGKPVKAVVTTSDAWPHIGGLREYAARGIPIFALDLNVPIVEALLASPRERDPDALARAPRAADIRPITGSLTLGEGSNRLEIHPVRGEGGERMLAVWLPEHRVLYASDLVQIMPDGAAFWPEYLMEVAAVVEREGLDPETVFAMHTPPMPWERVVELLADASAPVDAQEAGPADFDPERLTARSDSFALLSDGTPIGGQRLALERITEGWRFTESTRIVDRMSQETTVLLNADLAPQSVRQTGRAMGDSMGIALDYAGARATGTARTPSPGGMEQKVVGVGVPPGVVDDNTLQALLPALPWSPTSAWTVPVFSGGRGEVVETELRVTSTETIEVPAGTFEAYRVEVRREEAPAVFWVTTAEPHVVVKGGSLVAPFEFVLVEAAIDTTARPRR